MVQIDGAHFETFVSTDMGQVEGSKGSLVKENEGNHSCIDISRNPSGKQKFPSYF